MKIEYRCQNGWVIVEEENGPLYKIGDTIPGAWVGEVKEIKIKSCKEEVRCLK